MPNYWACTQRLLKLRALQPTLQSPCSASKRSHTIQQRFHLLQLKSDAVKQIKKKKKKRGKRSVDGTLRSIKSWNKGRESLKGQWKRKPGSRKQTRKVWWNKWVHFSPLLLFPTSSHCCPLLLGPLLQPPNDSPCSFCHFLLILHLAATVCFKKSGMSLVV